MLRRPILVALIATIVFATSAIATASPALAASRHICTDHEVVNGATFADLLVPTGVTCTINHVAVGTTGSTGEPLTRPTELNVVHSTVTETINPEGMAVNVVDSALTGLPEDDSILGATSSLAITHSTVVGAIGGDASDSDVRFGDAGSLTVKQSTVGGPMRLYGERRALLQDSRFTEDDVELHDYASVTIHNSTFSFGVGVHNTPSVQMCNVHALFSEFYVTDTPADGHVILGGTATGTCPHPTVVVTGVLHLVDNADTTPIDLKHVYVYVDGDLICTGNAVAPLLEDVTVTGTRTGQCTS